MSSEVVIDVQNISKYYRVHDSPVERISYYRTQWLRRMGFKCKGSTDITPESLEDDPNIFWALRNIGFQVRRGESVGILGMNGAGKSTLLQLIAGIIRPSTGTIQTYGRLAGLFELGAGFNAEFTGRENVFLNAAILGFSRPQVLEHFEQIERFAGIGDFIDRPVKTYSSGMMVRLAFAVQVQLNPDILVVDEALAVGDALFQKRCYERIERFLSDGGSLLFVSHDQESVRTLTNRALLLDAGRAVCMGTSGEVVLEYRKLLHEAENRQALAVLEYLSGATQADRAVQAAAESSQQTAAPGADALETPAQAEVLQAGTQLPESAEGAETVARNRSQSMSFGDLDVEVLETQVQDANGALCALFYPCDKICVHITFRVNQRVKGLNLGFRLRSKEGVKVYSGGSFNEDMLAHNAAHGPRFWDQEFDKGDVITLEQSFECRLGEGYYEIQAYVSQEGLMAPGYQRMLHWVDESAFFRVSMNKFERWYGGVCDIQPHINIRVARTQDVKLAEVDRG